MVTLKGSFKVETGEKWNMFPLLDTIDLVIEFIRWFGIWMKLLAE